MRKGRDYPFGMHINKPTIRSLTIIFKVDALSMMMIALYIAVSSLFTVSSIPHLDPSLSHPTVQHLHPAGRFSPPSLSYEDPRSSNIHLASIHAVFFPPPTHLKPSKDHPSRQVRVQAAAQTGSGFLHDRLVILTCFPRGLASPRIPPWMSWSLAISHPRGCVLPSGSSKVYRTTAINLFFRSFGTPFPPRFQMIM